MINLTKTCVLVRTQEENEMLLKEAEKQGFHWYRHSDCKPLETRHFPDILKFHNNNNVTYNAYIDSDFTFYEASELLGTKEMGAKEFIKRIANIRGCKSRSCLKCVLDERNTKSNKNLCDVNNWKENIDEIIEIAKSGKSIILTEEKAIENIEKLIQIPEYEITDEIVESLKLAVEKLRGSETHE